MMRKLTSAGLGALLAVALTGCDDEVAEAPAEPVRPVKTLVIEGGGADSLRSFPARIESSRRADLSFRVPGKLQEILVREGERVEATTTIARLDPTDYRLVVNDRQAEYDRTKKDFERAAALVERGNIARQVYDRRRAEFRSAEAALGRARQDLAYTELKAPFAGEIARRYVQNFEDVQAKQPVLAMRDVLSLEVKFDVPEQVIIRIDESKATPSSPDPDVLVSFASAPDNWYALEFKEMAARADPATQTFEVTYTMSAPENLTVLPGMTASVTVDLGDFIASSDVIYVPVQAVVASNDLAPRVWVVDEASMTVAPRPVEVGAMRGHFIAVTGGLSPGDRIVTAGVPFLVEGMKVSLWPTPEQAAERPDDAAIRSAAERRLRDGAQASN